jgi:hypothetical protein
MRVFQQIKYFHDVELFALPADWLEKVPDAQGGEGVLKTFEG